MTDIRADDDGFDDGLTGRARRRAALRRIGAALKRLAAAGWVVVRVAGAGAALLALGAQPALLDLRAAVQSARTAESAGDPAGAAAGYRRAYARQPWQVDWLAAATRAEIAAGQYAAAARDRAALAAIRPLRGEELLWEGDILAGQGQPDAALAAWKTAWQQGVIDAAALRQIAGDARARGDWTAERQALGALVALGAAQSPDYQRLGLLQALDAPEEAVATLAHAAVASPDPAHSLAPVLAALDGRVSEPEEQYLTRLAVAFVGLDELELAQTALERAVGTNPVYGEALAYLAYVRSRLGEPALGAAEQAMALSPDNPTVFYLAGLVWKRAGRPVEARLAFEQAYALDSTNPAFAIEIASTHRAQHQEQTAELWMQQAQKLAPDDFRVRLLVAQFYVDDEYMVTEKGLPLIQQLAAEAPDNAEVHATLSWAYFVTGHVNQAFEEMNTALSLNPDLPRANAYMGALLESQNRLPEAVYYYDRAVQLDPDGPFGAFAQRALERINGR